MTLECVDVFCGAGGSSLGLESAGFDLRLAANHWDVAIDTHSSNFPDADHLCADVSNVDKRRFPRMDLLWASPECTTHSPAGGRVRKRKPQLEELFDGPLPDAALVRSRATAYDVLQIAELRRPPAIIVENVVEFADWELFDYWLTGLTNLGYTWQLVSVNSAHIWSEDNAPAPQWRDRLYIVAVRDGLPMPDVAPRPLAWCLSCEQDVAAVQVFKPRRRLGKYRQQYHYACPHTSCRGQRVEPYLAPALVAIDWTDVGERIGDRKRPLAVNTMARIRAGVGIHAQPVVLNVGGNTWEKPGSGYVRAWPVDHPLTARTKTPADGIACPPLVLNVNHDDLRVYPADERPLGTRTVKIGDGVVAPFITMLRGQNRPKSVTDEPLDTVAAGGRHHALTVPGFYVKHFGGNAQPRDMVKSFAEPLGAITTKDHHSLVMLPHRLVIPYYRTGRAHKASEPLGTRTTHDRDAVITPALEVEDCYFRMLQPREHLRAQRFPDAYVVHGNKGEQTMQAGNAVSSNVAHWLAEAVRDVLERTA